LQLAKNVDTVDKKERKKIQNETLYFQIKLNKKALRKSLMFEKGFIFFEQLSKLHLILL
jgi:hypothetical protein